MTRNLRAMSVLSHHQVINDDDIQKYVTVCLYSYGVHYVIKVLLDHLFDRRSMSYSHGQRAAGHTIQVSAAQSWI